MDKTAVPMIRNGQRSGDLLMEICQQQILFSVVISQDLGSSKRNCPLHVAN